jgi:hypothetical protein
MQNTHPPVHGKARLRGDQLTITVKHENGKTLTTTYTVARSERTIRLTKADGEFYDVSFANKDQPRCPCGDLNFRDREDGLCKHLRGLVAVGLIRGNK